MDDEEGGKRKYHDDVSLANDDVYPEVNERSPSQRKKRTRASAVTIRKAEVDAIEKFLANKQRGQFALIKRKQVEEDRHVYATDAQLHATSRRVRDISLSREGLFLANESRVIDEQEAFQGTREKSGRVIEGDVIDPVIVIAEDGSNSSDEDMSEESRKELERLQEAKEEKMRMLEERYEKERKEREEKIFSFYEQVDQVVSKITATLGNLNKEDSLLSGGFTESLNTQKKLCEEEQNDFKALIEQEGLLDGEDAREMMQIPSELDVLNKPRNLPAVDFCTEDEIVAKRMTKGTLDELTNSIQIEEMVRNLGELADWGQRRMRESLHEEQNFYMLLRQVEEQALEAEDSSRTVQMILQNKESLSSGKIKSFSKRLNEFRLKGSQAHQVISRIEAENRAAREQQAKEGVAILQSQVAMNKARLISLQSQIQEIDADPSMKAECEILNDLELRHEEKTKDLMTNIQTLQNKVVEVSKHVSASSTLLRSLKQASERAVLRLSIQSPDKKKKKSATATTRKQASPHSSQPRDEDPNHLFTSQQNNPTTNVGEEKQKQVESNAIRAMDQIENVDSVGQQKQRQEPNQGQEEEDEENDLDSYDESGSDFFDEGEEDILWEEEEAEMKREEERLRKELEAVALQKQQAVESQRELEIRQREVEKQQNDTSSSTDREMKLEDQIAEVKRQLAVAKTSDVSLDRLFHEREEKIAQLLDETESGRAKIQTLQSQRDALQLQVDRLETDCEVLCKELLLLTGDDGVKEKHFNSDQRRYDQEKPLRGGKRATRAAQGRRKTDKPQGPKGDIGLLGDSFELEDKLHGPCGPAGPEGDEPERENKAEESNRHVTLSEGIHALENVKGTGKVLAQKVSKRIREAYAPFRKDPKTGEQVARNRTNAQLVRSEKLCGILTREEQRNIRTESAFLRRDVAALATLYRDFASEVSPIRDTVQELRRKVSQRKELEALEISRRQGAAESRLEQLLPEIDKARRAYRKRRAEVERIYAEELDARTKEMSTLACEVKILQGQLNELSNEIKAREEHSKRAEDLVLKLTKVNDRWTKKVLTLRIEIEENSLDNPGQRAKRIRRQIKAMELDNIKLNRKVRELQALLRKKERDKKLAAEAKAAVQKYGMGQKKTVAKSLFEDDEETRARKKALRKEIRGLLQQLARWRHRWQVTKKATSLAAAREKGAGALKSNEMTGSGTGGTNAYMMARNRAHAGRVSAARTTLISFDSFQPRVINQPMDDNRGGYRTGTYPWERQNALNSPMHQQQQHQLRLGGLHQGTFLQSGASNQVEDGRGARGESPKRKVLSPTTTTASGNVFSLGLQIGSPTGSNVPQVRSPFGFNPTPNFASPYLDVRNPQKPSSPNPTKPFSPRSMKLRSRSPTQQGVDATQSFKGSGRLSPLRLDLEEREDPSSSTRTTALGISLSQEASQQRTEGDDKTDTNGSNSRSGRKKSASPQREKRALSPDTQRAMLQLGMEDRPMLLQEIGSKNSSGALLARKVASDSKKEQASQKSNKPSPGASKFRLRIHAPASNETETKEQQKSKGTRLLVNSGLDQAFNLLEFSDTKSATEIGDANGEADMPEWMKPLQF